MPDRAGDKIRASQTTGNGSAQYNHRADFSRLMESF